ncbi:hypothetical protein VTO42DRAFT_8040 [Malbranchea cinnamomea]
MRGSTVLLSSRRTEEVREQEVISTLFSTVETAKPTATLQGLGRPQFIELPTPRSSQLFRLKSKKRTMDFLSTKSTRAMALDAWCRSTTVDQPAWDAKARRATDSSQPKRRQLNSDEDRQPFNPDL